MKKWILVSAFLISGFAFANHSNVRYDWPSVNGLTVNNACYTANTFRSLQPVSYCSETKTVKYVCRMGEVESCHEMQPGEQPYPLEYIREEVQCVSYAKHNIEVSRTIESQKCVKYANNDIEAGKCLEWTTVQTFVGTEFDVAMYRQYAGEAGEQLIGYTHFSVPACH